jgi:hypothetical protein
MHARARCLLHLALAVVVAATATAAEAQPQASPADGMAAASADDRKQAAKDFADGDHAFKEGDFRGAALAYERAYARVPHHSALWNAARAWQRAGELARAANHYAHYLREAPPSARDRNNAQKAMNELSNRLARIEVHATDVVDVQVDGQAPEGPSVFVTPGAHVVTGRTADGRAVRQSQSVEAGDVVSVALVPPAPAAPVLAGGPPAAASERRASRGWSPVVVYFGGAVALALTGITVWSGVDTLQQKDAFDKAPTQNNLDVGKQKETRTNVLVVASAGVAALTLATAIVLVDWRASPEKPESPAGAAGASTASAGPGAQLRAGLGSLALTGSF